MMTAVSGIPTIAGHVVFALGACYSQGRSTPLGPYPFGVVNAECLAVAGKLETRLSCWWLSKHLNLSACKARPNTSLIR